MIFDELLTNHIGEFGKYQIILFLVVGFEEVFQAFQSLNPVFTAATPSKYWCEHHQLYNDTIFGNLSLSERLRMTIPPGSGSDINDGDGLSKCLVYDVTYEPMTSIIPAIEMGNHFVVTECSTGWLFDQSVFTSTMVTEVRNLISHDS